MACSRNAPPTRILDTHSHHFHDAVGRLVFCLCFWFLSHFLSNDPVKSPGAQGGKAGTTDRPGRKHCQRRVRLEPRWRLALWCCACSLNSKCTNTNILLFGVVCSFPFSNPPAQRCLRVSPSKGRLTDKMLSPSLPCCVHSLIFVVLAFLSVCWRCWMRR